MLNRDSHSSPEAKLVATSTQAAGKDRLTRPMPASTAAPSDCNERREGLTEPGCVVLGQIQSVAAAVQSKGQGLRGLGSVNTIGPLYWHLLCHVQVAVVDIALLLRRLALR